IESCIKAGALDGLGGTRKQFMTAYSQIMEHIVHDKKNSMAGQLTLFDIVPEDQKEEFDIPMPDVGEYEKEMLLAFEKEVLGVYISGHPLEEYQELWRRNITNKSTDFTLDEETGEPKVRDQVTAVIGGMIAGKNIKYTKNDKIMAFLTLEDLVGSVEVVVFPQSYEEYGQLLVEEAKIFVRGRVSLKEEKDGNLICDRIVTFEEAKQLGGDIFRGGRRNYGNRGGFDGDNRSAGGGYGQGAPGQYGGSGSRQENAGQYGGGISEAQQQMRSGKMPDGVWIQFADSMEYQIREQELLQSIADSDGNDAIVIYLKKERVIKVLPPNLSVRADEELKHRLEAVFGAENVKFRFKPIEKR
ncbi:MAG: DNA polymerase III subunit alpha, partial [Lachnospiraceae bacterium]|nr:DNA polymerase III subunit alpha [Lachnospiraceae bacterium]